MGSFTINDKLYILGKDNLGHIFRNTVKKIPGGWSGGYSWSGDDSNSMSFVYQGYFHPLDQSVLVWKKLNERFNIL